VAKFVGGSVFEALNALRQEKNIPARTKQAQRWFRKTMKDLFKIVSINEYTDILNDPNRVRPKGAKKLIGEMYMFRYKAKWEKILPYYDQFPLIFIIGFYDDGFLGINLHYLPIRLRVRLFNRLMAIANNKNFTPNTRLKISYAVLKRFSRFHDAAPCIKRYLISHVRSRLVRVPPEDWDIALFLPVERFKGASKEQVWADSRKRKNRRL
jgi:hypothetical protein